jgi:hypothetical protein
MLHSTYILVAYAVVVLSILYYFAWKYRESNKKNMYDPKVTKGKSVIFNINQIDRGYQHIDTRLNAIGAEIVRKA